MAYTVYLFCINNGGAGTPDSALSTVYVTIVSQLTKRMGNMNQYNEQPFAFHQANDFSFGLSDGGSGGGLPSRESVAESDTWDLTYLFKSDADWENEFTAWEKRVPEYEQFKGKLSQPDVLLAYVRFDLSFSRQGEKIGSYAMLKSAQDVANGKYQTLVARVQNISVKASQASSYMRPEVLAIDEVDWQNLISASAFDPYRLLLERVARDRPHTLSTNEEQLLAMLGEFASGPSKIFGQLNNADLRFGMIQDENGRDIELTNGSLTVFLNKPDRELRKTAFHQFYKQYGDHKNTLAATLNSTIQKDNYYARARKFDNAMDAALFHEEVPHVVYDNLIAGIHEALPALYRYYDLRKRKMGLPDIRFYDTYVPILSDITMRHTWEQGVDVVIESLRPLGQEYCTVLHDGLLKDRWSDRYENRGKRSGAFSAGTFDGLPYILMNYQQDVIEHVFTLTHEAGHSMHSWYSVRNQPYQYYDYVIFVAEVASTFNEQLLTRHLLNLADNDRQRAWLINREIDSIRGTIFRQTMFAEFEKITHDAAWNGEPLTVDRFREIYGQLLRRYFGPDFAIDDDLTLECFRIPHFYRGFYVYKYATGLSAAIALAQRVLQGGLRERDEYLAFLKGGCSKEPLDLLRDAGVDMTKPEAIRAPMQKFASLVDELERLL